MFSTDGAALSAPARDLSTRVHPAEQVDTSLEVLESGIERLDALLPGGGFPRGQLSELSGSRSCGKRALACSLVARTLERHERAVWIDGSGGFYPLLPLEHGVPLDRLIVVRPEPGKPTSRRRGSSVRRFPSATRESRRCPPALKAADILMQAGRALALCVVDLPARTTISPRLLARLRLGAETSGTAVLFITEQTTLAGGRLPGGGHNRRIESLGTFISLQLCVAREASSQISVTIAKSKRGRMAQQARVKLDGPHSLRVASTL